MLKNYLLVTLRNIRKYKMYSFINIAGLAVGIAVCKFISLYISNDLNYDKFNKDYKRIYRVCQNFNSKGKEDFWSLTPSGYAKAFENEFPGIKSVRVSKNDFYSPVIKYKEKIFTASDFVFTDNSLFSIFDFQLIKGNTKTALTEPFSIVFTQSQAAKIFGEADPIGETILVNNIYDYKVTGILKDPPNNSSIQFNFLAPMKNLVDIFHDEYHWTLSEDDILNSYQASNFYTFILLDNNSASTALVSRFPAFVEKYCGEGASKRMKLILQPLDEIHFTNGLRFDFKNIGNKSTDYILSIIGLLLLFIGCINFINISTAHTAKRTKEIGLRKVLGAHRSRIIWQFITENLVLTTVSIIFAILLLVLLLPYFNSISGKQIEISSIIQVKVLLIFLAIWFFVIITTSSYPAIYLSSFQPVEIIRGYIKSGQRVGIIKKSLIILQFIISIFLIIVTLAVSNQYRFLRSYNTGFNKDQLIYIPVNSLITQNYNAFKSELLQRPDIKQVSRANWVPGEPHNIEGYTWPGNSNKYEGFYSLIADNNLAHILQLQFVSGRNFFDSETENSASYIINETAAKKIGWTPETAIGKTIISGNHGSKQVAGVIKDFNFESLHKNIEPVIMMIGKSEQLYQIIIKINSKDIAQTINSIDATWKTFSPQFPFDFHFLDKDFENLYLEEERMSLIITLFSALSIIISSLGLLGLISHAVREKTKEIGIRKTVGASVLNIFELLTKDFIKLILIANFAAWPVAYYLINIWLQDFAYRIDINLWMFILAGGIAFLIAILTISFQIIKAATANPVESLKYE